MTNQQGAPEALRPIARYKIGYHTDDLGMRSGTPSGIPDRAGAWMRYEDHIAALVEAQQPAPSAAAHKACKPDMLVNGGALKLALNVLRRAGKHEVADELEATAQPSPTPQADSAPASVAGPMQFGGCPECGSRSCVARECSRTVSHTAQAIPGVQWQCGPQASGFTAPQADSQPAPQQEAQEPVAHDEDLLEQLYWDFDSQRKKTGEERLAFKGKMRSYASEFRRRSVGKMFFSQSVSDDMMNLADRLGALPYVDPIAWKHLLVYAPKPAPVRDESAVRDECKRKWLAEDEDCNLLEAYDRGWKDRAARAPADSVTAPMTPSLTDDQIEKVYSLMNRRLFEGKRPCYAEVRAMLAAAPAPPAQAADSVLEDAARLDFLCSTDKVRMIECEQKGLWRVYQDEAPPEAVQHHWQAIASDWHTTPRAAIDAARKQGGANG